MPGQAEGEFALVKKNLEAAASLPGQPVKRGTMAHAHNVYAILADSAVQLRDLDVLRQYTPLLEELAARDGHRLFQAVARRAWGVTYRLEGEHSKAVACFESALGIFEELKTRWQMGRTLFEMGELAQDRDDQAAARQHFNRALAEFEAMRAMPDAGRTQLALQALG